MRHPIAGSLEGTENDWLLKLLVAFNTGDITAYTENMNQNAAKFIKDEQSKEALDEKIAIMAIINYLFGLDASERKVQLSTLGNIINQTSGKVWKQVKTYSRLNYY